MRRIILLSGARTDLDEAVGFLEKKQKGLGIALLSRFYRELPKIQLFPLAAPFVFKPFRRVSLKPFSYGIVYSVEEDAISIAAVMHDRRNPDYWKHRI